MQFCWAALTASVDVADGVVFIVACSEVGTDAGTVLSVFCGGLLGIFPMLATPMLLLLLNRFLQQGI